MPRPLQAVARLLDVFGVIGLTAAAFALVVALEPGAADGAGTMLRVALVALDAAAIAFLVARVVELWLGVRRRYAARALRRRRAAPGGNDSSDDDNPPAPRRAA